MSETTGDDDDPDDGHARTAEQLFGEVMRLRRELQQAHAVLRTVQSEHAILLDAGHEFLEAVRVDKRKTWPLALIRLAIVLDRP